MSSSNVVSIRALREVREAEARDHEYAARILVMDKLELLEEMVRFQEERTKIGKLTLSLMVRGKSLFRALEQNAVTREMKLLTSSYRRHLDHELRHFLLTGAVNE